MVTSHFVKFYQFQSFSCQWILAQKKPMSIDMDKII